MEVACTMNFSMLGFTVRMLRRGEVLLLLATALALIVANSALAPAYFAILNWHGTPDFHVPLSPLHFINDGLMAIFFLSIGLEIKREALQGALATWPQRILPAFAALGGMLLPAAIFTTLNLTNPAAMRGWAIPTATDIAFALGILAVVESRVPPSLKNFLAALAILDDLGAILIIAFFYAGTLTLSYLGAAAVLLVALWFINRRTKALWPVAIGFILVWYCFLQSGIHATLAGVAVALSVPVSKLETLELRLAGWVIYLIVPLFAFANAGVSLADVAPATLLSPIAVGVALGLFLGKQFGVFAFTWAAIASKWGAMPEGATWRQLYGVAALCGIGFTMSLFISSLGFANAPAAHEVTKIAVLAASSCSAALGLALLWRKA